MTITVTASTQASEATVERVVEIRCPKGRWCTAGQEIDCTEGTYNPFEEQDLGKACLPCPTATYAAATGFQSI